MKWRCLACKEVVDYDKFKCGCITSPAPWEPIPETHSTTLKHIVNPILRILQFYTKRPYVLVSVLDGPYFVGYQIKKMEYDRAK